MRGGLGIDHGGELSGHQSPSPLALALALALVLARVILLVLLALTKGNRYDIAVPALRAQQKILLPSPALSPALDVAQGDHGISVAQE